MEDSAGSDLLVLDAMDTNPWTIAPESKIEDGITQLMQRQLDSCVVVEKSGVVRGALDLKDLLLAQVDGKKRKLISELIPSTAYTVGGEASLIKTIEEMKSRKLSNIAILEGKILKGELRLTKIGSKLTDLLARKDKLINTLESDMERKDEYLGLVSHDMRAPLTVISLSSDYLLAEESAKSLSQDQRSFIERIKRNGEMATSMIHDILDVVRLDHGFRLDYQKVLFSALLQESVQNLDVIAAKKNVTLNVTHDQEIQINLDPKRMRQVIENLVGNAIKFSPQGGQVFLRSWLAQRNDGSYLALQVRDQGHGIRKEDEARVFEAFVQAGRHKEPGQPAGVGLGLAIVRKFVEFHQGSIELDGGWQKGVSITVLIPGASLVAAAHEEEAAPTGPIVLLVEDDESIREFYKQSLDQFHYHVLEAGDGSEGFALFQQYKVDLILSDIRMPKMDGLEMLAKIRMTGSTVPVILCSGYYVGLENDLSRSDHKPNRIIDKPFKVKDMVDAIEEQLRKHKQAS